MLVVVVQWKPGLPSFPTNQFGADPDSGLIVRGSFGFAIAGLGSGDQEMRESGFNFHHTVVISSLIPPCGINAKNGPAQSDRCGTLRSQAIMGNRIMEPSALKIIADSCGNKVMGC